MRLRSKYLRSCGGQRAVLGIYMLEFIIYSGTWELCGIIVSNGGMNNMYHICIYFKNLKWYRILEDEKKYADD